MTRCDCVWVPRHLIREPVGVRGLPPSHVASPASRPRPLAPPCLAPPQGATPAAAAASAGAAVRSPAPLGRTCAGCRGECPRLAGNPAPPLHPPWLDTLLDTPERDTIWGWLLPCLTRPSGSWTPLPHSESPMPGPRCPQRPQCAFWPRALGALWGTLGAAQVGGTTASPDWPLLALETLTSAN